MAARLVPGRKKILLYSVQQLKRRRPVLFHEDLTKLFDLLRERRIAPIIAERMPLQEVRDAHERLGSGSVRGKIILLCEPGEHARAARSVAGISSCQRANPVGTIPATGSFRTRHERRTPARHHADTLQTESTR
jgi:hypothetical protein